MESKYLVERIARQFQTKAASTFFINGAPGSGKTFLLAELAENLSKEIPRLQVLGPYRVHPDDSIGNYILGDLRDYGYLQEPPEAGVAEDINSTWQWLKANIVVSSRQSFSVLIDLEHEKRNDYESLRIWFSSMRYLEHLWDAGPVRLIVLIAGSWDHAGLEEFYNRIGLSFPYTSSVNYLVWDGVSAGGSERILVQECPDVPSRALYGRLLHEIAGGHPGAMKDILARADSNSLSVQALLSATYKAAQEGSAGLALLSVWKELPADSLLAIERLLIMRQIPVRLLAGEMDRLHAAGILARSEVLDQQYAKIRCWYIELLLRLNSETLNLRNAMSGAANLPELMPAITELHLDAYRLINEIENLLRNFVVLHLSRAATSNPLLTGHCPRRNLEDGQLQDAQERAVAWKERSAGRGLPVQLNPIVAYLSMHDLGVVLTELPRGAGSNRWREVAAALDQVVSIRDAVMHNQIIEIKDLQKVYDLYGVILSLLGQEAATIS